MIMGMSEQTPTARQWCEDLQIKLMKALDEAWAMAASTRDPDVIIKAMARAKLCGQIAAMARKVAALVPAQERASTRAPARAPAQDQDQGSAPLAAAMRDVTTTLEAARAAVPQADITRTALQRLKAGGGRRGRL